MQVEEWEGFAMLGGNCNCKSQVSLRAPSSSDPRVSPPTNILSLFPSCSESLDNHRRQSLPVVKSHRDLRMPALQLFGFNLTDSMTAFPESLTSVKQAENCLHSRGHCALQIWLTNREILSICGKKSLWPGDDSSLRVGGRVGTDRECRGLERRLLH